ncbi:MAG: hypothetical protein ACJ74Q_10465 [Pyrinomonadaceae bacterium]
MPNPSTTTRKANAGAFRKGSDPRRHVHSATCGHELHEFTFDERVKGFWNALESLTVRYDDDRARTFGKFLRREGRFSR